jgi:hypothetical protein
MWREMMGNRITANEAPVKLYWDDMNGEGLVRFSAEFYMMDWVTQADMLQDFICELQEEYNELLEVEGLNCETDTNA